MLTRRATSYVPRGQSVQIEDQASHAPVAGPPRPATRTWRSPTPSSSPRAASGSLLPGSFANRISRWLHHIHRIRRHHTVPTHLRNRSSSTTRSSRPPFEPTNHHTPLALRSRFGNDHRASVGFDARHVPSVRLRTAGRCSRGRDTAQAHRRRRLPLPHPSGRRLRQHRTRPKHVVGVLLRQRRIPRPLGRHRPGIPVEHRCPRRLRARPAGNLDGASGFRGPRTADGRTVRGRVAPQRRRHHQLHPGPGSPTGRGHRSRPPGPPIRRAHRRNRVPTGTGRGLPRAQHQAAARSGTPPSTTTSGHRSEPPWRGSDSPTNTVASPPTTANCRASSPATPAPAPRRSPGTT